MGGLPYQLTAYEYAPWGIDVESEHVQDFTDLGRAFDAMFTLHEHASAEIKLLTHNQALMSLLNEKAPLSEEGNLINQALSELPVRRIRIEQAASIERKAQEHIRRQAWDNVIPLSDALPIIEGISRKLVSADTLCHLESMHAAASAINQFLFQGKGALLRYQCADKKALNDVHLDSEGTVFVVLEDEQGALTFISADCGIHHGAAEARTAVASRLPEKYAPLSQGDHIYWIEHMNTLAEIHLDQLEVDKVEPIIIDVAHAAEAEDHGCVPPEGYHEFKVVQAADYRYRKHAEDLIKLDRIKSEPTDEHSFQM